MALLVFSSTFLFVILFLTRVRTESKPIMCVILNVRKYDPVKFLNGVISEVKILYLRLSIYSHFYPMFDHAKKKKRNGINKHSKVKTEGFRRYKIRLLTRFSKIQVDLYCI